MIDWCEGRIDGMERYRRRFRNDYWVKCCEGTANWVSADIGGAP